MNLIVFILTLLLAFALCFSTSVLLLIQYLPNLHLTMCKQVNLTL